MLTIDDLLNRIELHGIDQLSLSIPNKDRRILKNLAKMIKMPAFITESQGRLLIKILQENLESLHFIGSEIIPSLRTPTWTKAFRSVDSSRKISIVKDTEGNSFIDIECAFNKDIKRALQLVNKSIDGFPFKTQGRHCQLLLTEKNLINTINELKKFNFEYSTQVESLYKDILAIDKTAVINSFNIEYTTNKNIQTLLDLDIGERSDLLVTDRRIKYQFKTNYKLDNDNLTLKEHLAFRSHPKVFVNTNSHSLTDLTIALKSLKRNVILGIFDEYDVKSCIQNLELLHTTLTELNMKPNIGVYFRFPNDGDGKKFNELVSEYGYNKQLDKNCRIAIIANGKLPKFFLKTKWYPNATVSFSNQFRNNKTSIYCNNCDMIVYYNTLAPLTGVVDAIV
jgi:hypothetical protein